MIACSVVFGRSGSAMIPYRIYCMGPDGRISMAEWIEASDDADAVRQAQDMKPEAVKCEVWQDHRLVAKIDSSKQLSKLERDEQ